MCSDAHSITLNNALSLLGQMFAMCALQKCIITSNFLSLTFLYSLVQLTVLISTTACCHDIDLRRFMLYQNTFLHNKNNKAIALSPITFTFNLSSEAL